MVFVPPLAIGKSRNGGVKMLSAQFTKEQRIHCGFYK
jgi:hypothetical protein